MHFQGYIELTKVMRFTALKKIFNDNTLHIEPRKGTQQQAIDYCQKLESRVQEPVIFGEPTQQGKRKKCVDVIKMSVKQIIEEDPIFYL